MYIMRWAKQNSKRTGISGSNLEPSITGKGRYEVHTEGTIIAKKETCSLEKGANKTGYDKEMEILRDRKERETL